VDAGAAQLLAFMQANARLMKAEEIAEQLGFKSAEGIEATRVLLDSCRIDLKDTPKGVVVIEVNDNPSIEAGFEDLVLKDELYNRIMRVFVARIMAMKRGRWGL